MARKSKKINGSLLAIIRQHAPHDVLAVIAKEYEVYTRKGVASGAEYDYWVKCARSTANLSSGMEKWLQEWIEEEEEGE